MFTPSTTNLATRNDVRILIFCSGILVACSAGRSPFFATTVTGECTVASLPAYAHNDYTNTRPLTEALQAGYSGVEADVFLIDGELRVGHDRRSALRAGRFVDLYVAPLSDIARRCGRLTAEGAGPFLLAVEIKEHSRPTYDAVLRAFSADTTAFAFFSTPSEAPIEVVMVGWQPPDGQVPAERTARRHHRISSYADTIPLDPGGRVRLLSLDYGKAVGRWWRTPRRRSRWLATLAAMKRSAGGRRVRVHNVPVDSTVYDALLRNGVDLIGTKDLARGRAALAGEAGRWHK